MGVQKESRLKIEIFWQKVKVWAFFDMGCFRVIPKLVQYLQACKVLVLKDTDTDKMILNMNEKDLLNKISKYFVCIFS